VLWCALMKVLFHRSDCVFLLSGVLVISRIVVSDDVHHPEFIRRVRYPLHLGILIQNLIIDQT
jgi:hypothetical protein